MSLLEPIQSATSTWFLESLAQVVWQGTLLAAIAAVLGLHLKSRSAESRYVIHCVALGLTLACLPWNLWRLHSPQLTSPEMMAPHLEASVELPQPGVIISPIAADPDAAMPLLAAGAEAASPPTERTQAKSRVEWQRYTDWLFVAYLAGTLVMLARLLAGLWGCQRLRADSQPVYDPGLLAVIERATTEIGLGLAPIVSYCARVATPVVVGVLKPAILLPPAILAELTPTQLESLLLHELAHIKRYDHLVNLAQRIVEVVLFFHPAVWWLSSRISIEREHCCDDLAIRWGSEPCDYAESLVQMSEFRLQSSGLSAKSAAALAASGRSPSRLHARVLRVLGMPLPGPTPGLTRRGVAMLLILGVATVAVVASRTEDRADEQKADTSTDSDRTVAEARAKTFGLQRVRRIAFAQSYQQTNAFEMEGHAEDELESLWKVRATRVADAELDRNRNEILLAWDGDRLLLESFTRFRPDHSWRQTHYWDGQQGWIGETSVDERGETKNVYRYGSLDKLTEHTLPIYFPQWAAAGDRLPWPGPKVLFEEHHVDPALTHYRLAGTDTIDGVHCDIYDGPDRHEKIWVERATKLVKAISRHYVSDFSQEENWQVISEAAGRKFDDQQDYQHWLESLSAEQRNAFDARWSAASWKRARPGNLTVFSDYRKVAPGVHWPHQVDHIVVHPSGHGDGIPKYFVSKIEVKQLPKFELDKLAANALPEPGVKVTDRTGEAPFEYKWSVELDQAKVKRLREEELAKKSAEEEETRRINATPINSVDDAIHILTEGPKADPTKVWARAIKYLADHPEPALPALIEALDKESRDHPISKLAFALRAIGDARAVPALIRAFPRTLQPSRSDYGLRVDDDMLGPFMQEHDLGKGNGWSKSWGWMFDYGRAFREVVGALHELSGQDFGEMQLNGIHLSGTGLQRRQKSRLYLKFAERWADWWELNWRTQIDDPAYRDMNLVPLEDDGAAVAKTNHTLPSGVGIGLTTDVSGAILQSVHESNQRCFVDLDTGRESGWPQELPSLGKKRLESPELLAWARWEGFDVIGITYIPAGETHPLYCIVPLDLRVWQITEDEHRALPDMILGKQPYPLSKPVDLVIPRRTIPEPRDPEHSGDSFLFVTREGTAGVLRITAQVTEARDITGQYSTADDLFQGVGFYRGVKYELKTISAPAVPDPAANTKRSNAESPNGAGSSDQEEGPAPASQELSAEADNGKPDGASPAVQIAPHDQDDSWKPNQVMDVLVVNAQTQEPLPGVSLELQNMGPGIDFQDVKVQTTDAEGRATVRLPDLPPTAVRIYPSKLGFVPLRVYWEGEPSPVMPKSITIPMTPGKAFGGTIRNEAGEPIPDVEVTVHYWGSGWGEHPHLRENIDHKTTSGKDGRWQVNVMPAKIDAKELRIYLGHPDYVSDHVKRAFIPTPITEQPPIKDHFDQTAVMTMRKGETIRGRVINEAGQPIANANIHNSEYYWLSPELPRATIDSDGRFRISGVAGPGRTDSEMILTIQAAGYAPKLVDVRVRRPKEPLEVELEPGRTVLGQIVDEDDNPIEGVSIRARRWREHDERLHLEAKSDADGNFRLTDAPADEVTYIFGKDGYIFIENFPMSPSPDEYRVTMKAQVTLIGSVVDAETGKPLDKFTLTPGIDHGDGRAPDWMRHETKTILNGRYETKIDQEGFLYRLRVEAEGYLPGESRTFRAYDPDKGEITYDFKLSKTPPLTGTVLGLDGKPLANADVYLAKERMNITNRAVNYYGNNQTTKTGDEGRFTFASEVEPFCVVAVHKQGIAMITQEQFEESMPLSLQPWTDTNKTLQIIRRPAPGESVDFPEKYP